MLAPAGTTNNGSVCRARTPFDGLTAERMRGLFLKLPFLAETHACSYDSLMKASGVPARRYAGQCVLSHRRLVAAPSIVSQEPGNEPLRPAAVANLHRLLVKRKVPFAAQRTPRDEALAASMN
jgi:hypothetical protein